MIKNILFVLFLPVLAACQSGNGPHSERGSVDNDIYAGDDRTVLSEEFIGDIVYSFSSIVEIPALIKDMGVPYSETFLLSTEKTDGCHNNFERAFLLGALGTNLGYMNMYNRTNDLPEYLGALRRLTDSVLLSHLFNFVELAELAVRDSNQGLLMNIYMQGYNRTDQYLREDKRAYLSTAIISGVWIEGLYLLTRAAAMQPDGIIFERIGEQKIILNDLIIILRSHEKKHQEFSVLIEMLASLKEEFDQVEIVYEVGEPHAVERNGMLIIVQNQTSTVNIDRERVLNIISKTENIRNILIL